VTAEQRGDERAIAERDEAGDESAPAAAHGDASDDHLSDVPDGSGCAEIWEYLSEERGDDD